MREYNASPQTSRFRLEGCILQSATTMKQLESLLPLSANAFILGCLTRISALQQLSLLEATSGGNEKTNYKQFAADCTPKLREALNSLIRQNESRVSPLIIDARIELRKDFSPTSEPQLPQRGDREPPPSRYGVVVVRYTADGIERRFVDEGAPQNLEEMKQRKVAEATAARNQDVERIEADFMNRAGLQLRESILQVQMISTME